MTHSNKFLIVGFSVLAVSACTHPNAMPTGYTYHEKEYKSPDATPAVSVTQVENQKVRLSQMDIDLAVDDLLRKITARAGVSPKPVYILAPSEMSAFYTVVDSALRKNMRDLGYAISDSKAGAYAFAYNARELRKPRGSENDGYPNVELTLQVFGEVDDNARLLTQETGNYFIAGASDHAIRSVTHEYKISDQEPFDSKPRTQAGTKKVGTKDDIQIINSQSTPPEMIDQGPIVPEIEFKSLSTTTEDNIVVYDQEPPKASASDVVPSTNDSYGAKPVLRDNATMTSGRVSKKIDY